MAKTVIIVDDSKAVVAMAELALDEMIKSGAIEFKSYLNPLKLLEALQNESENFDLLISDINMPELSGMELAKAVKSNDRYKTNQLSF